MEGSNGGDKGKPILQGEDEAHKEGKELLSATVAASGAAAAEEEDEEQKEKNDENTIHEMFNKLYGIRKKDKDGGKGQDLQSRHKPSDQTAYSPRRNSRVKNGSHKIVGLGYAASKVLQENSEHQHSNDDHRIINVKPSIKEKAVRLKDSKQNKIIRFVKSNFAAVLVFFFYLVKMESVLSCMMTVGLTLYWYFYAHRVQEGVDNTSFSSNVNDWSGSGIDWVVLGFAVVTPITVSIGMAFRRRELALYHISRIRSVAFQFYLAHAIWNWDDGEGRDKATTNHTSNDATTGATSTKTVKMDWLQHTDRVLGHLIGICDELSRFLTLPTSSRTYHRMLKSGRMEAAEIVEVQYRLFDSLYTKRVTKLTQLTEVLKSKGLSATEGSRLRQFERYIGEAVEGLRMIKMYRTPQALRSFGRMFTLLLPPLYAASFSSLAIEMQSLTMGILFAIITPLCLTALFESMTNLEDPFVGWTTLDGIDVAEELEVLHWHQLNSARLELYPNAKPFSLTPEDEVLSEKSWQRDDMFNLKLLEMNKDSNGGMSGSYRLSSYALDATSQSRKRIDVNSTDINSPTGIDSTGRSRVSHYAMDASSGNSHRRIKSDLPMDTTGMDGSGRISHFAMNASSGNTHRRIKSDFSFKNLRSQK